MSTTFGWSIEAARRDSCWKRARKPASFASSGASSFRATRRSSAIWVAQYTTPMPPRPASLSMRQPANTVPESMAQGIPTRAMSAEPPRDSTIAVVGDGFGSLIVYATAVYLGFAPEEVTIYGPSPSPVGTYQQFAYNLGQTVLRSESESHFLPADWPTFAELEAWSRRSLSPLIRSTRRRYNPGVPDVLGEANVVARRLGWNDNRYVTKVGWLQRAGSMNGDVPHFVLFD